MDNQESIFNIVPSVSETGICGMELIEPADIVSGTEKLDKEIVEATGVGRQESCEDTTKLLLEPCRRVFGASVSIYWHPSCSLHDIPGHPEQPGRVDGILHALRQEFDDSIFRQAPLIDVESVKLFHTENHVNRIIRYCDETEGPLKETRVQKGSGGTNPMHRNSQVSNHCVNIDGDTIVMSGTRQAMFRAAGSVTAAIDEIFAGEELRTAFCCVRPPGHHAERNKAMGFCFFNNAAIGARYAQHRYGVGKVAVLDFDVHHGNGTEEGFTHDETLFYGSTHQKDAYPGTGIDPSPHVGENAKKPLDRRIVNRYLHVNLADDRSWPSSSSRPAAASDDILLSEGLSLSSTRGQFRIKWKQVIDEMILFAPELIIFSAGFDAHDDDPLADCELVEEDFDWATSVVLAACVRINPTRPPRYLSVLEGGYDLEALARSAVVHVKALAKGYPTPPTTVAVAVAVAAAAAAAAAAVEKIDSKVAAEQELDTEVAALIDRVDQVLGV